MRDWRQYTKTQLHALGRTASKSLGQHFLVRMQVIQQMIASLDLTPATAVLEIGGGLGILTEALLATGCQLTIIEKDEILAQHLETTYPSANVIAADALQTQWPQVDALVANLPYGISSQIVIRGLHLGIPDITVMLQQELADRCMAKHGSPEYSRLSIISQLHAEVIYVINQIPPEAFYPPPKVYSAVLKFTSHPVSLRNDHMKIEQLARNLFSLRRRTLRSVVRGFLKRKVSEPIWDNIPRGDLRINALALDDLDDILDFLQSHGGWPLA